MKRYFCYWLAAIVVSICSATTMCARNKVTSIEQLKAGDIIKIYPRNYGDDYCYNLGTYALACSGDEHLVTSFERAGKGDLWILVDAGEDCFYLKNDLGCYMSDKVTLVDYDYSITGTTNINDAVKVSLTWDPIWGGVCFWNQKNNKGLRNQFGYCYRYNWLSSPVRYDSDSNTTFDVDIVSMEKPEQLKVGSVVKIYPRDTNVESSNFGDRNSAFACNGDNLLLESYRIAGSGDSWTIVDAGDGWVYLKNNLDCYWKYSTGFAECVSSEESAVKVKLTWNDRYHGVCFWNQKNGTGFGYDSSHKWFGWNSTKTSSTSSSSNCVFDLVILQDGSGASVAEETTDTMYDGLRYVLYLNSKTATLIKNTDKSLGNIGFQGDVVVPQYIPYKGNDYEVTSVDDYCFFWSSLNSLTLPGSITYLGNHCFENCYLSTITLPDGVTSLGDYCFASRSFTSVTLPNSIQSMGVHCFDNCSSLTEVTLPNSITSLGRSCFIGCTNLSSITLPETLTSLDPWCFSGCKNLASLTLPEGITSIGTSCFMSCKKMRTLSLPSTLRVIGEDVFMFMDDDIDIYCHALIPPINENDDFISSRCRLFVPEESLELYKSTSPWNKAYSIEPLNPEVSIVKAEVLENLENVKVVVNKRNIFVEGLSEQDDIQIVNAMGVTVYRGVEHEVELSAPGIYMVKAKGKTVKICIK